MKLFALLLSLLLTNSILAFDESRKTLLSYKVDSVLANPEIDSNQTLFSFHFYNADYDSNRVVQYAFDDVNFQTQLSPGNFLELKLTHGKHKFIFYFGPQYYEVYTDSIEGKAQHTTFISVFLQTAEFEINVDKPVLYFYPSETTDIEVKVDPTSPFTFTYPEYRDGWKFSANPEGKLTIGKKDLNYLFWESKQKINLKEFDLSFGSIVDQANITSFLEKTLEEIGFTSQEKEDFITFWGPQMILYENCFVQFLVDEKCNDFARIDIKPVPNKLYRYYILIIPLENGLVFDIAPQKFEKMDRDNFTVLEWGGFIVEDEQENNYPKIHN